MIYPMISFPTVNRTVSMTAVTGISYCFKSFKADINNGNNNDNKVTRFCLSNLPWTLTMATIMITKWWDSVSSTCLGLVVLQPMSFINYEYFPVDRAQRSLVDRHQLVWRQQYVKLHAYVFLHPRRLVATTDCTFFKRELMLSVL